MKEDSQAAKDVLAQFMGVKEFLITYPQIWPTRGAFDFAHHRRHKNGMADYKVTIKRGNRVLINPQRVLAWLENECQ